MNTKLDLPVWLLSILSEEARKISPQKGVLNLVELTEASEFYNRQFNPRKEKTVQSSLSAYDEQQVQCSEAGTPRYMKEMLQVIEAFADENCIVVELGGGQHQARSGCAFKRFHKYVPLDISAENMLAYSQKYKLPSIACDATKLPFKDSSIDIIFTHTFLEHPTRPDRVVEEIIRVLRPGGWVFHADAWNCRWWQRYGFHAQDFRLERNEILLHLRYLMYRFYETTPLYQLHLLMRRAWFLFLQETLRPKHLLFTPLTPNYGLSLYSDEDAAASLDPIVVGNFYRKRGFTASHSVLKKMWDMPRFISAQKRMN